MANKKKTTRAEKAVSATKQKQSAAKKNSNGKNSSKSGKNTAAKETTGFSIPVRFVTAVICMGLFILFGVIALNPEGALVTIFGNLIMGLIGKAAFLVAIPVLLYLFFIQAFSGKKLALEMA